MSHFKVLVIGDNYEDQLAPYDENMDKKPYREDDFDDLDNVKSALAWDQNENNSNKQGLTDPGDDLDARLELLSDYCGGDLRINKETGHVERWTTYNPDRYTLVKDDNGTRSQEDYTTGNEVLFEVRGSQASGGLSEGLEDPRWSIRVLPGLPEREEQGTDSRPEEALVSVAERDSSSGVRSTAGEAGRDMRDMSTEERGAVRPVRGPLTRDRGDSGVALSEMQHGDRLLPGFSIRAGLSGALPSAPSGYRWELIGGSKWDYYVVGGHYNTTFKIKAGADEADYLASQHHWSEDFGNEADHENSSDRARKRAIDFAAMVDAALDDATQKWKELVDVTEGIDPPERSWVETLMKHGVDPESRDRSEEILKAVDEARAEWHNHPWNVASRKAMYWDAYDQFHMGEEDPEAAYRAERAAMAIGGFYAIVQDGNWTARGDMGWFGMSSDTIDRHTWVEQTAELIKNLPDDTWLTAVDCHI